MDATHNYQLFFQAFVLLMALYFTFALLSQMLAFYVRGMNKQDVKITASQWFMPAMFWAIFFWLIKAQF